MLHSLKSGLLVNMQHMLLLKTQALGHFVPNLHKDCSRNKRWDQTPNAILAICDECEYANIMVFLELFYIQE